MRVVTSHTGRPSFVGRWIRADRLVVQASKFGPSFQWYDASTHKRAARRLLSLGPSRSGQAPQRLGFGPSVPQISSARCWCPFSPACSSAARCLAAPPAAVRAHVLDRAPGGYRRRRIGHQSRHASRHSCCPSRGRRTGFAQSEWAAPSSARPRPSPPCRPHKRMPKPQR